jgi:hypothetical protein
MTGEEMDQGSTIAQPVQGGEVTGSEVVPAAPEKPKPDMYTVLLAVAVVAFLVGVLITATELHDLYDVQFWIFTKK